ncbi:GNAT family N-acetyltransferase [Halobaculum sp. CBA1158]|uniref:GNAT family N-acetyltransferase n=1 Tax=Halobaculum sp. CBA1158 TaxID=2904243 RepID=UPI001F3C8CAC|nr:GNAT family protein [Halobaculum sp. CBA1158]UIP00154.1 GNAT family N-acetyltransferase [Halobaculum sp. CBA1158]
MTQGIFPERIETDRLRFERIGHEATDVFELYDLVRREDWRGEATTHMPWFRFDTLDDVSGFVDHAEEQWKDRETARYLLRSADENGDPVGVTAFGPEWDERRAGSGIVLAKEYWGREYGLERASAFVELTFERYDLDAFYTTCARDNEPSRRMIEKYVDRYGGRHEGVLRHHSARPSGTVTDQHRFSIVREEYERATEDRSTLQFDLYW